MTEVDGGRADRDALRTAWRDAGLYPNQTVGEAISAGCASHAGDRIVFARGPKQFLGYQDPAADVDAFVQGTWFRTGDLARFDEDGYLVVTDRVKDIIIRGGENISARDVEEVLANHPAVAEVAVCAAPDDVWGEMVCAVVVPNDPGAAPTVEQLGDLASSAELAPHKLPTRVVTTDSLPRTAAGKVRKRDLRPLL